MAGTLLGNTLQSAQWAHPVEGKPLKKFSISVSVGVHDEDRKDGRDEEEFEDSLKPSW